MFLLVGHNSLSSATGADSWVLHSVEEVAHMEQAVHVEQEAPEEDDGEEDDREEDDQRVLDRERLATGQLQVS
jgi:hypothetical protein